MYCPFCCLTCQTLLISIHEVPGMVEELADHICRAHVKAFACGPLGLLKPFLIDFSVSTFTPAPILSNNVLEYCQNKDKMHAISIGLSSQ
jgi:hypothetical protein